MRRNGRKVTNQIKYRSDLRAINSSIVCLRRSLLCRCCRRDSVTDCRSPRVDFRIGGRTEILADRVAICRPTNHCRRRSRDRWATRQTHNVKKRRPTPLITAAPPRMRRRKSFVHFPPRHFVGDLETIWRLQPSSEYDDTVTRFKC